MGVRGKIEAVIYAAEEPVTLAQLTTLFGAEALAERTAEGHVHNSGEAVSSRTVESAAFTENTEPVAEDNEQAPDPATQPAEEPDESAAQASDAAGEESSGPLQTLVTGVVGEAEGQPQDAITPPEPFHATGEPTLFGDPDADKRAARLRDRMEREAVRTLVQELISEYEQGNRGMEIREIAGGYRVATKPEYHDAVRAFVRSLKPPMKLSLQALETLAVIAYKQPVTAPEVSEIRGVDSGGVLGSLIGRKLVTTAGRKQVVGRPILYKTTKEFLLRFGLKDLAELPSMEEFAKMTEELEGLSEPETQPAEEQSGMLPEHAAPQVPALRTNESDGKADMRGHAEEIVRADLGEGEQPEPLGARIDQADTGRESVASLEIEEQQTGHVGEPPSPVRKA